jgi:peptidoglycan/xylan/chitin deacetylase (PgdA/CDA1 family)
VTVTPRNPDDRRPGPDPARPAVLTRRVLLTLGAAAFTEACTHTSDSHAAAPSARPSGPPSSSHPPLPPSPKPWKPATVARPVGGHCPVLNHVGQRPDGAQNYVPCHGTDIGLTIDDGPHPTWTPLVLKLLQRFDVTATFCVIGRNADAHPQLAAAIVDAGHEVANHTWTHPLPFAKLPVAQVHDEIHRASDLLTHLHAAPTYFRAPGGEWTPDIFAEVKAAGLRPLGWSIDPRDWARPGVPHIVDTILRQTRPGAIILDHDGGGNRQQTIDALTIALPRLIDAGYNFVTPNHRV